MKHFRFLLIIFLWVSALFLGAQEENPIEWKVSVNKLSACEAEIVFNVKIEEPWHLYSIIKAKGADAPNPTRIMLNKSDDYEPVGAVKESKPQKEFDKVFETDVLYFKKNATFKQKIKLKSNGKIDVKGKYEYQICTDEKCMFPPPKKFSVSLEGVKCDSSSLGASTLPDSLKVAQRDKAVDNSSSNDEVSKELQVENVISQQPVTCDTPWWLTLLKGIAFGLASLITPCVFPMIPMNVSFFLKRNKKKSDAIKEALIFVVSIVGIFVLLGLSITAIFGATALNAMASSASFNLIFFFILLIFGISFMGAFEIVLPASWINKMDAKSDKKGFTGIFFMAATLALVSFSCTSVFIGNLLTSVADCTSGPFWGFFGFGFGFAIPFGLFSMVPSLLNSMPRSGGWLNTVKVTLGLLELALALKFASNADLVYQAGILTREVFLTLWIVLFGLTGAYLMGWFRLSHDSDMPYLPLPRFFFALTSFAVMIYLIPGLWGAPLKLFSGVIPPSTYAESPMGFSNTSIHDSGSIISETDSDNHMVDGPQGIKVFHNNYDAALNYAKKVNKPLLLDFTGYACANCRKMEDNVWTDPEVKKKLTTDFVIVSLFVDDRKELPKEKQEEVDWDGDKVLLETEGLKWGFFQTSKYKISAQPYYVVINHNEQALSSGIGYDTGKDVEVFKRWLDESLTQFKK